MELSDYKDKPELQKGLIGQKVLIIYSGLGASREIDTIIGITKTGVKVGKNIFGFDGYKRGGKTYYRTRVQLLHPEEAEKLYKQWAEAKKKKKLIEQITPLLASQSLETIKNIQSLLTPKTKEGK